MISVLIGIVSIALTFGIAVFVHELGHYTFARLRGVGVEAFAIGMGPKIFSWTRGGTEYSLRLLPIGGFVRLHQMIREEAEAEKAEEAAEAAQTATEAGGEDSKSLGKAVHEDMAALYDKGVVTKYLVFGGGVFFNFLTAIAATALFYMVGFTQMLPSEAKVDELNPDSAVAKAGLRQGDRFVEIEKSPIADAGEAENAMRKALEAGTGVDGLDVKVARAGAADAIALKLPPLSNETAPTYLDADKGWSWELKPLIGDVIPFKPAAKAGLKGGDLVLAINGKPVQTWSEMSKIIRANANSAIELKIQRKGSDKELLVSLVPVESAERPGTGAIGIVPGSDRMELVREDAWTAIKAAPKRTKDKLVWLVTLTAHQLTHSSFRSIREGTGGPIAIAALTYRQAQMGFSESLDWFIKLNLLLLFFNLLPIPILDGGFILLSTIEAVIRRPVPAKILEPIFTFFAFCFIGFFILVSYQDILNTLF